MDKCKNGINVKTFLRKHSETQRNQRTQRKKKTKKKVILVYNTMPPTVQFILQDKNFYQAQLANVVGYGC